VNIMLMPVVGTERETYRRLVTKSKEKPVLDSGNYKHAFAVTEMRSIRPGRYVLILSTYYAGQVGAFTLSIASSSKVEAELIP
jgi:hypothetical protein